MINNKQRNFMESVNSIDEWVKITKEFQAMLEADEFVSINIQKDSVIIDSESVTLNNSKFDLNDFVFTDFEEIYIAFCEY